jgi:hypothetical protein
MGWLWYLFKWLHVFLFNAYPSGIPVVKVSEHHPIREPAQLLSTFVSSAVYSGNKLHIVFSYFFLL